MAKVMFADTLSNMRAVKEQTEKTENSERKSNPQDALVAQLKLELEKQKREIAFLKERLINEPQAAESKGFTKGYEKGIAESQLAVEEEKNRLTKAFGEKHQQVQVQAVELLKKLNEQPKTYVEKVREDIVELVFIGVGKVLGAHYLPDRNRIRQLVSVLVDDYKSAVNTVVKVGASDFRAVNQLIDNKEVVLPKSLSFKEDSALEKGSYLVVSDEGELDARLSTLMSNLMQILSGQNYA